MAYPEGEKRQDAVVTTLADLLAVAEELSVFVDGIEAETFTPDQRQELSNKRDDVEEAWEATSKAIRTMVFTL